MKTYVWFIFWILGIAASLYILADIHEAAHSAICKSFGGNATANGFAIDRQYLIKSTTCALPAMTEARYNAYSIADSSGEWTYLLQSIILTMFFCTFLIKIKDDD